MIFSLSTKPFPSNQVLPTQKQSRLMELPDEIQRLILSYLSKNEIWGSESAANVLSKHFYKMISSKGFVLELQNHHLSFLCNHIEKFIPLSIPQDRITVYGFTSTTIDDLKKLKDPIKQLPLISKTDFDAQIKEENFKNSQISKRQKFSNAAHLLCPGSFLFSHFQKLLLRSCYDCTDASIFPLGNADFKEKRSKNHERFCRLLSNLLGIKDERSIGSFSKLVIRLNSEELLNRPFFSPTAIHSFELKLPLFRIIHAIQSEREENQKPTLLLKIFSEKIDYLTSSLKKKDLSKKSYSKLYREHFIALREFLQKFDVNDDEIFKAFNNIHPDCNSRLEPLLEIYIRFIDRTRKPILLNPNLSFLVSPLFPIYLFKYPLFEKITSQETKDFFQNNQLIGFSIFFLTSFLPSHLQKIYAENCWRKILENPDATTIEKICMTLSEWHKKELILDPIRSLASKELKKLNDLRNLNLEPSLYNLKHQPKELFLSIISNDVIPFILGFKIGQITFKITEAALRRMLLFFFVIDTPISSSSPLTILLFIELYLKYPSTANSLTEWIKEFTIVCSFLLITMATLFTYIPSKIVSPFLSLYHHYKWVQNEPYLEKLMMEETSTI